MSYCSHQLLDYDPNIGLYRCRDCPVQFEARAIHGPWKSEPAEKVPNRVLPIAGIGAGLVFALAVLFMFFKLQNDPNRSIFPSNECNETKAELKQCLSQPPKIKIVEIPTTLTPECPACPEFPGITIPECPAIPPCPQYDPPALICPQVELPMPETCPETYKADFQECMADRGALLNKLGQCGENDPDALRSCKSKTEELRGIISRLTLNQGQTCPSVAVRGCEREITAACGHLREALEFYFDKSKTQPGKEDSEGYTVENTPMWGVGPIIDDSDADFQELDLED